MINFCDDKQRPSYYEKQDISLGKRRDTGRIKGGKWAVQISIQTARAFPAAARAQASYSSSNDGDDDDCVFLVCKTATEYHQQASEE